MSRKRLVIIDGYSLLFRAFYGTRFLSTSDGRPTNALFGFTSMLFELFTRIKPDAMVVALDAPGKTFRHAEYAEYKGTRRETPQELISQLDFSRTLIADLNIPCVEAPGYEADDVVGTISLKAEQNGYDTYIVTGDLDSLQLVDEQVHVMTTQRGVSEVKIYDEAAVQERYGFGPEHIPDYKALVGDTSDNIKGVPGIGEKSATLLIQKFGSVEQMLERLDEVDEKFRKKIEPNIDLMKESKWLATIIRDVPLDYDFAPYSLSADHVARAKEAMTQLEFRSHVKRFDALIQPYLDGAAQAQTVAVVRETLEAHLVSGASSFPLVSSWVGANPFGVYLPPVSPQASMFDEEAPRTAFIAVGREVRQVPAAIADALFAQKARQAVIHDSKPFYRRIDPTLPALLMDTFIGGYVLQSGRSSYDFADLVSGYLDVQAEKPEERAVALLELQKVMESEAAKTGQTGIIHDIELPLIPVLAEMESYGIALDTGQLGEFSKSLEVEIEKVKLVVYEMAGEPFNIGSPKQVGELLFEKLQIPGVKKTKTGYATGAEILSELAISYPICAEILTYRELTKLKSTYADSLPKMVNPADGRIHTTFSQAVAATGRLSSSDPNLQNIPIRTELGRSIRKAFVAAPGYRLGSFDYSQIELRILAHMCHDDALVRAFQERIDVHTVTASLMFGESESSVTKEQRRLAKMLNYAVLYGVTDFGLAAQLGVGFGVAEAKALITQYNERFPKVKSFTESIVEEARAKGFTTTLLGRRRYFADIHAGNRNTRMYAERQAVNAPLQGTAADMIKAAMLLVRKDLGSAGTRMLLQVHDELVFELDQDGDGLLPQIRNSMEQAMTLDVPIEADGKVGKNWLEMTPI